MKKNNDNRFDIDLDYGEAVEDGFISMLKGKVEVKAERNVWLKTGNIAIEYMYKGKSSGISVTEADWWVQALMIADKPVCYLVLPTDTLKHIARQYYELGNVCKGGDNNDSDMVLIPLDVLSRLQLPSS